MQKVGSMPGVGGEGRPLYTTPDLVRVQKCFTHHPERHNGFFYEEVADIFKNGRYVPFPFGKDSREWPAGIEFIFEHAEFIVLLPEPKSKEALVAICPKLTVEESHVERAAHLFAEVFVTEYRRFYSNAISHSKKRNGVS